MGTTPQFTGTNADHLAACLRNAEEAARTEANAREAYNRAPLTPGGAAAKYQIIKAQCEQRGWRDLAGRYRGYVDAELAAARAVDVARAKEEAKRARIVAARAADAAAGAEPGRVETGAHAADADAWEDERQTAWEDIGGAAGGAR